MQRTINFISHLLGRLPVEYQNRLYEVVLKYIPFWLLMKIPCSYSTYLKCHFPGQGDVVFDCGAHVGNSAIIFSRLVGSAGLVVSMEPFEDAFSVLTERLQRLQLDNVIAINKGLWNQPDRLPLKVFANSLANRIDPAMISGFPESTATIRVTTIDRVVEELNLTRVDLIKMDIEGAEIEALQGCAQTLETLQPCLAVASYHNRNGAKTYKAVERFLRQKDFIVNTFFPPHLTTCARHKSATRSTALAAKNVE